MLSDKFWSYFFEIYEAIPRQGPGDRESTERALGLLPPLTSHHRILDAGCGSGTQTIDLARATAAQIVAVDSHEAFVTQLVKRAADQGLGARIQARVGDINELAFADGSFDVIWCEGAIVIINGSFAKGLSTWRRLLVPGGHMVVSELCWLRDDPPTEVKAFFDAEGADVTDMDARRKDIAENGYRLVDDFVLPAVGWWENYYVPLGKALDRFRAAHAGDDEALEVAARSQYEIDLYRGHPDLFGYGFFVFKVPGVDS
ncbi:MAG: class I SAM-dependent methyltransferase [Deltaproteobacteria bacterium]|nr:class I SAM-dependent methyltransferase [Deltaproteobacteria bacterium]